MASKTWKGSISFGLVNIPVGVYLATEDREFSFNQLCANGHRIRYKKWCPVEEREVAYSDIKKGYEITKDQYIILEKQDLDKIKLKTTNTIDIKEFVDEKELDPIMIEKSYYVAPDNKTKNDKAYSLLVKVLTETKKIAVGKVVFKDKEHIVALRPYQRAIVMHLLHYLDEIRPVDEISELKELQRANVDTKELSLGKMLVENLSSEHFDLSQYSDAYAKELEKLIDSKAKGKPIVAKPEKVKEQTKDLVAALKASLQKSKKS
ncbi:MAG TPA: Ku protein [Candidatus Nitrosopolaris rasttigaisensis]|nr:Ku protein [Candidatus Nitrosopolaris rasttigaisensis]